MHTQHRIYFQNAERMAALSKESVALVVTSPPYPMIAMWDDLFFQLDGAVRTALQKGEAMDAFELMHRCLDPVWRELDRVLIPGGIACINIGDATRTTNDDFMLYPNHARILNALLKNGFSPLPEILWRKQTNAPNKFMGSGMLPPGAYVTLEHEHILVLRKGPKRVFETLEQKQNRHASAYFWEERNQWFSDVWMDLKGTTQRLADNDTRQRSAAFPFELPYRLISMFSVKGDLVLDPFLGTGMTMAAAMAAGRNSVGCELFSEFLPLIHDRFLPLVEVANERIDERLSAHVEVVRERRRRGSPPKHYNEYYGFPVVTKQETRLLIDAVRDIRRIDDTTWTVDYATDPQPGFKMDWEDDKIETPEPRNAKMRKEKKKSVPKKPVQQRLL